MQRQGEHVRVARKDGSGAIALVHIEVDHEGATGPAQVLRLAHRHGHVIEHAEPAALPGPGMVGTTREVDGHPFTQGNRRGRHRGAHRTP